MAIIGLGTDLVEIVRIANIIKRYQNNLAKHILSNKEWQQAQHHCQLVNFLAKRFAVKEAAVKALGTGFRNGLALKQVEVFHDELGKPWLNLLGQAKVLAKSLGVQHIHVSLSDEHQYAYATVLLEN